MKIGIVGDIHWSKYSSIIRSRGNKYSTRLENCIDSINWAENVIQDNGCDITIYLGDFFDSSDLCAEELSALNELNWNDTPHIFLIGNHEMGMNNLSFSSSHVFNLCPNAKVISTIQVEHFEDDTLVFMPYILEDKREDFNYYVHDPNCFVFSHNDIKGIQMGPIISRMGFDIEDINNNCKMFFNGHIHNGSKISDKIINVGNLTGQNFSEDAIKYNHSICVFDTHTSKCAVFDNPYAFNFFKFDITESNIDIKSCLENKSNPVITLKLKENQSKEYDWVKDYTVAHKIIIQPDMLAIENDEPMEVVSINHLEKFKEYIIDQIGNNEYVLEELEYIVK